MTISDTFPRSACARSGISAAAWARAGAWLGAAGDEQLLPASLLPVLALTTVACAPLHLPGAPRLHSRKDAGGAPPVAPGVQWLSFGRLRAHEHLLPIQT